MPRQAGRWSPTALRILGPLPSSSRCGVTAPPRRETLPQPSGWSSRPSTNTSAKRDILAALVRLAVEWPLELFGHITAMPVPAVVKLHRWLTESLDHLHASPYVLVSILITPDLHQESFVAERS